MFLDRNKPASFFLSSFLIHACFFVVLWILSLNNSDPTKIIEFTASVHFVPKSFVKPIIIKKPTLKISKPKIAGISRPNVSTSVTASKPVLSTSKPTNQSNETPTNNTSTSSIVLKKNKKIQTRVAAAKIELEEEQEEDFLDTEETEPDYSVEEINKVIEKDKKELAEKKQAEEEASKKNIRTSAKSNNPIRAKQNKQAYQSTLQAIVKQNFQIPNVQKHKFLIEIHVLINTEGKIESIDFIKKAVDQSLNTAVERALKLSEPFPKFPDSFVPNEKFLAKFRFDPSLNDVSK